eukprot:scaffold8341_cov128-Isochrysis_galbana.AAC.2
MASGGELFISLSFSFDGDWGRAINFPQFFLGGEWGSAAARGGRARSADNNTVERWRGDVLLTLATCTLWRAQRIDIESGGAGKSWRRVRARPVVVVC